VYYFANESLRGRARNIVESVVGDGSSAERKRHAPFAENVVRLAKCPERFVDGHSGGTPGVAELAAAAFVRAGRPENAAVLFQLDCDILITQYSLQIRVFF